MGRQKQSMGLGMCQENERREDVEEVYHTPHHFQGAVEHRGDSQKHHSGIPCMMFTVIGRMCVDLSLERGCVSKGESSM